MPELPEVQTTVGYLNKKLVGLRFKDVWTDWPKTFRRAGGFENFKKAIKGKKILSVKRRAKFIVIDIEGQFSIFIHQKLSGHLLYGKWKWVKGEKGEPGLAADGKGKWVSALPGAIKDDRENGYIRTLWDLSNGWQLGFSDLRRFGAVILVKDNDVSKLPEIRKLGPEPLDIALKQFRELFHNKKGRIKQVLMDPFFIAGIGNIYADEILWATGIHPLSRAENLTEKDIANIYREMQRILKHAIKLGGSSVDDYRMPSGEKGGYQDIKKAYQREGEKCEKRDGGVIKRIQFGGRSSHFCPKHQKIR